MADDERRGDGEKHDYRDMVLDAFERMERDDLKEFKEKKQAVELAGRKRL